MRIFITRWTYGHGSLDVSTHIHAMHFAYYHHHSPHHFPSRMLTLICKHIQYIHNLRRQENPTGNFVYIYIYIYDDHVAYTRKSIYNTSQTYGIHHTAIYNKYTFQSPRSKLAAASLLKLHLRRLDDSTTLRSPNIERSFVIVSRKGGHASSENR